jgi:2-dehydro-3-deoxy-D-gluconate 5-dehydrogenase
MSHHFDIRGKTALVTGCSKGIGKAIAIGLAQAGCHIIGVSRTISTGDSDVKSAVNEAGQNFYPYTCDFTDRGDVHRFLHLVLKEHPEIDILVNNAGTIRRSPIAEHSDEFWDEVIATNLSAPFLVTREIGRRMVARGRGNIIFIASLLSFQGGILVPGYAASKGGVSSLIKSFANEWAAHGVNVNGIAPGYISTDNTEALRLDPERSRSILNRIPAGRWGEPEDFVGPTIFLASAAARYIHGTILTVDGGWMGR